MKIRLLRWWIYIYSIFIIIKQQWSSLKEFLISWFSIVESSIWSQVNFSLLLFYIIWKSLFKLEFFIFMQSCGKFSFQQSVIKNVSIAQYFIYSDQSFLYFSSIIFENITSYSDSIMSSFSDICLMKEVSGSNYFPSFYKQINTSTIIMSSSFSGSTNQTLSLFFVQSNPVFYKVINSSFINLNTIENGAVIFFFY